MIQKIPKVDYKGTPIPEYLRLMIAIPCPCGLQYLRRIPPSWKRVGFLFKSEV